MSEYIITVHDEPDEDGGYRLTKPAERIVRCRDCRFYATDELGDYCTLMDFEDVVGMADKFCAWAERREQ